MIIGNNNIINFLENTLLSNKIAHAYIFNGPRSIGKRTTAEWLSKKLLKTERLDIHPDFIELKIDTGIIKKDDIESIIKKAYLSSFSGGYKVILIHNAHQMNLSSANAFLKTLEEPSKKTVIILLTSELGKMLPTIISRSSVINFKPVPNNVLARFLKDEHGVEDSLFYAKLSYGRPGLAIKLAKEGIDKSSELKEFYNLFFGQEKDRIKIAKSILSEKGKNKDVLLEKIDIWLEFLRDIFFLKYNLKNYIVHDYFSESMQQASFNNSTEYFANIGKRLLKMKLLLKNNINPSLMLENLII